MCIIMSHHEAILCYQIYSEVFVCFCFTVTNPFVDNFQHLVSVGNFTEAKLNALLEFNYLTSSESDQLMISISDLCVSTYQSLLKLVSRIALSSDSKEHHRTLSVITG